MRVPIGETGVESDRVEQLLDPVPQCPALRDAVLQQWLADDAAHRHARIQAVLRVLEDHLHARAQPAQRLALQGSDVGSAKHDASRGHGVEAQDDPTRRRLPAAALPDEAQRLPLADFEIEAVDRLDASNLATKHALHHREVLGEVLDREERRRAGVHAPLRTR